MLLSFVFSFRNEEKNIPELVRQVTAAIAGIADLRHEMIFVNDDSTDGSLKVLNELRRQHPITIINMSRRFGVTPCVLAGFAQSKGEAVIYMDTDLQDPPELIPQMLEKFRAGAEVVHTTRTHRDGESAMKMWITKRAYRVINALSDIDLPENTGDYKLLSRKVVEQILSLSESDPYLRGLSVWVGYRQDFIYYRRRPRFEGETHMPLFGKGPIREFIRGLTAFSAMPLYFSLLFGMATVFVSFLLIVYAIVTKIMGLAAPGTSGVLIAVALFSGIVLITNGVIGLYVARIYNEVKRRPRYIVKEIIAPADSH
jgi:glycosyltransferase involved in cell wall biosynthesis